MQLRQRNRCKTKTEFKIGPLTSMTTTSRWSSANAAVRPSEATPSRASTRRLVDGTILALGAPAEDVDPCDPLALPPGARRRRLDRTRAAIERLAQGEGPSSEELNRAPLLDSWAVADRAGLPVLTGIVTGHPRLPAHSWVRTSPLVWLAEDRTAARTSSRWYRLGSRLEDDLARSGRRTPA
jgi:hypothetical protein